MAGKPVELLTPNLANRFLGCILGRMIAQPDTGSDDLQPVLITTEVIFARVYDELRKLVESMMFHERNDHTLSATALVNAAYVRLEHHQSEKIWDTRGHFFSAAAEAMRRILIDRARARKTQKRSAVRESLALESLAGDAEDIDLLLDLDALLDRLEAEDPLAAEFVKLRVFAGRSIVEAGKLLKLSPWSSYQLWDFCESWFAVRTTDQDV